MQAAAGAQKAARVWRKTTKDKTQLRAAMALERAEAAVAREADQKVKAKSLRRAAREKAAELGREYEGADSDEEASDTTCCFYMPLQSSGGGRSHQRMSRLPPRRALI